MKTGILCAMDCEMDLIRQDVVGASSTCIAGREFLQGTLYGKEVVVAISHIGKVAAALTATLMIQCFEVDRVLFSGVAGGIDPSLHVGDAVIGDYSVQHDFKLPECWGEPFRIPMLELSYIPSDTELTRLAKEAVEDYFAGEFSTDIPETYRKTFGIHSPKALCATIASGDEFICTAERNRWLYEHVKNAGCAEMEGAAVAQVCTEFQVPFTIVRVISDAANDDASVDYDQFVEHAAKYFTRGTVKAFLNRC